MTDDESSVRVAVRIRPLLAREVIDMCRVCTSITPGEPQVTIGNNKSFTYDFVFDSDIGQEEVFQKAVEPLVQGSLSGYNATVLAYGQTGSGKTYTMGTGFEVETDPEQTGIIPRAIHLLFNRISENIKEALSNGRTPPQYKVTAQFLELYNEDIYDLFDTYRGKSNIKIHEDADHSVYVAGVQCEKVGSAEDALSLLKKGALSRTTAATQMNCQSSRSHAIFTLHIRQQRLVQVEPDDYQEEKGLQEFETLTAKFHFVDLAGSERLKRTGATGERAKEGIAINCGLLALGNVISALGDQSRRALHIPYRDSKLTRLLQDSLGGNSQTLMIACVSSSDRDFMETLNTLKYANRARNIQNKVVINQDKSSRTISLLKKEIHELQLELLEYKQGKKIIGEDGNEAVNDMFHENQLLQSELEAMRLRLKGMQDVIDSLSARNTELLAERDLAAWSSSYDGNKDDMSEMVKGYLTEIENLRSKLVESESIVGQLRKEMTKTNKLSARNDTSLYQSGIEEVLDIAKQDLLKDLENIKSKNSPSDSESSLSENEDDVSGGQLSASLANLTSEINVKQRLIEALENTNRKLNLMKQQYEEKLMLLQAKIFATEKERDTVLATYANMGNKQPSDKIKKVKEEYERKLSDMQKEMKSLLSAKKEHAKLLRNQLHYENQIRQLNSDVQEMKRNKVRLMKKMREEALRYKEIETRTKREVAQLKKKSRQDATLIKNLEAEKKAKAIVLRRKQEEVSALRKAAQGWKFSRRRSKGSQAKHHWISLEKNIVEMAMNRQTVISLEKEMERKIEARTSLQEEYNMKVAMLNDPRFMNSSVLSEEVDSVRANLDHIQSAISDLQREILQIEESKPTYESEDLIRLIVDVGEAPYILEKLYSMALHSSCMNAEKDTAHRILQAEYEQLKRESEMQEQLLQHLVDDKNVNNNGNSPQSSASSRSPSPQPESKKKVWKALSPTDLLFPSSLDTGKELSKASTSEMTSPEGLGPHLFQRSLSYVKVPSSAPGSPVALRKGLSVLPRKTHNISNSSNFPSMERGLEVTGSPLGSPTLYRRQTSREENVFSRLTSQPASTTRHPGRITACTFKKNQRSPIFCSHVVEGHSCAVLAVHVTEENLFTASRDRSVIIWDLQQMKETEIFAGHPNNVVAVKYEPGLKLVLAASSSFVKVWDRRTSKCVHTLLSSGMTGSWSNQQNNNGDPQVNDIALGDNGFTLYTAAGDKVRAWDLRKFSVTCKLVGGHQAAIMCLAVGAGMVVTGSKDHYIKLFDVDSQTIPVGVISSRVTLDPPHYDGIECLQLSEGILFSGSRDGIIKKWNTQSHELMCSLNGAHKDWVTGLCRVNSGLVASASRDGTVKLWSPDSCSLIGEVKAHSSAINAIASNSTYLFTASNLGEVKMWRRNIEQDIMTMSTGHMLQLSV